MSTTPSGWYPNPHNAAEELYWDGSGWLGASRVRIVRDGAELGGFVQGAGLSSAVDDATVIRPSEGSWPAPSAANAPSAAIGVSGPAATNVVTAGPGLTGAHTGGAYPFGAVATGAVATGAVAAGAVAAGAVATGAVAAGAGAAAAEPTATRPVGGHDPGTVVHAGYDPSWGTMPPMDGQPVAGLFAPGQGAPYPAAGYASQPGVSPLPAAGFASPLGYAQPGVPPYPYAPAAVDVLRSNGSALASLLLGIGGLVLTAVPLLIGLVAGGVPDLLAIVFGILGIVRSRALGGTGFVLATVGTALGALGLCLVPLGAGWLW